MRDYLKEEAEGNSEVFHQELQHSRKTMNGSMGEEFQPLSSPPRSSLRSGRSPTRSRGRVRGRVTFAQDCSSDYNTSDVSTPDPQDLQPHLQPYDAPVGRGQAPWTPPLETDPEPQDPVQAPKAWASECSHAHWPSLSSSLTQLLQPLASPPPRDTELDLEARTSRLLRLTSDLYVATHLSDDSTVLRRFSEGASRCQSPAPRSVSVDRLLNHQSPRLQQASRPQHGGSPQRQSMKQSCLDALTPSGPVDYTGQAAGSGLYSGLYSSPPLGSDLQTGTRYNSVSATQSSRPGLGDCHSVPRNPSPQPGMAELSSSLRGLLDLVDQHWVGTRSLHLNPIFLGQAYDLLSALGSPPAAPCLRETEQKGDGQNRGGEEQSGSPADVTPQGSEIALLKRKLTVTQQQLESLKKRLVEALKDNYNLRLTSLKQDSSTTAENNCGRQLDRCLQRQVNALREQETHLRQLEQTMVLLQGNHRCLVSNNNSLLGHLNEHTTEVQSPESRESSQQTNLMTSASEINS
ncbi:leucine-rich repeat-containing protein 36-like [Coregonus clupeaformis]|uniref:leucine-rich repeat-containing protein 36-like n=1 Tax=Coregonus clupeaformis TaxID=59861 RepID=UPI001BE08A46|nr:leucine-rich repeat-containing protein 36-like [Coregonus clupeaformis]XP_045065896.1 leucine-rich repeat-containing protein 36-like [Coregonus clupeaformis]